MEIVSTTLPAEDDAVRVVTLDDAYPFPVIVEGPRGQGLALTVAEATLLKRRLAETLFSASEWAERAR